MSEVVVVGSFTAKPGQEEEARKVFEALVAPTHGESGCILYALHRGVDDPRKLAFIERWASREELDAHLNSAHVQEALTRADELWAEDGEIIVYEPIPGGETKKGALKAHAGG